MRIPDNFSVRTVSVLVMALGLCCHFFGNELARAAAVSLISAKQTGLDSSALTYTISFGCPASALTLYAYTSSIRKYGTQTTFRISIKGVLYQFAIVGFFAFREIYSTLLSTQQWAFVVSGLDHTTSSYIVIFSGAVSIASMTGGLSVEQVVNYFGVYGLLSAATISLLMTTACAEIAFYLRNSIQVTAETPRSCAMESSKLFPDKTNQELKSQSTNHSLSHSHDKKRGPSTWSESLRILSNSTLQLLVLEALAHQFCSNMLNIMFYDGLRKEVPQDDIRAVLVGRFFAMVNLSACLLQCFVLPKVLSQRTLPYMLIFIPIAMSVATGLCSLSPSLISIMLCFGTLKVLEYAVLSGATEMIYMPLDPDTRYLGKEYVGFFGTKLGKTGASLCLSSLASHVRPSLCAQCLWGATLALLWGIAMSALSLHLRDRAHASVPASSHVCDTPVPDTDVTSRDDACVTHTSVDPTEADLAPADARRLSNSSIDDSGVTSDESDSCDTPPTHTLFGARRVTNDRSIRRAPRTCAPSYEECEAAFARCAELNTSSKIPTLSLTEYRFLLSDESEDDLAALDQPTHMAHPGDIGSKSTARFRGKRNSTESVSSDQIHKK